MNFLGPKCIEIFFDLFLRENSNIDVFLLLLAHKSKWIILISKK